MEEGWEVVARQEVVMLVGEMRVVGNLEEEEGVEVVVGVETQGVGKLEVEMREVGEVGKLGVETQGVEMLEEGMSVAAVGMREEEMVAVGIHQEESLQVA